MRMRRPWLILCILLSSCAGSGLHFRRSPDFDARRAEGVSRIEGGTCRAEGEFPKAEWTLDPREPKPTGTSTSSAKGSLMKSEIQSEIRSFFPEFKDCYAMALERDRSHQGMVKLRFVIGPTGEVIQTSVPTSDIDEPRLAQCMVELSCAMHFPKPRGGGIITVTYPFAFSHSL